VIKSARTLAAVGLCSIVLSGCSGVGASPTSPQSLPSVSESANGSMAPSKTAQKMALSWRSACLLSAAEVDSALAAYGFHASAPAPLKSDPSDITCDYDDTSGAASTAAVDIKIRPYGDGETYGWLTSSYAAAPQSWAAPDASGAATNACKTALSWTSRSGLPGICAKAKGVPYAVDPARVLALSFPTGTYFVIVQLFGIGGDEQTTKALVSITNLVADRVPS